MKYDFMIVGAGLFGSIFAYKAKQAGKRVLVIDKRSHIAGNCFTESQHGINVHKYGPHIFHTNNEKIWNFMGQFATFNNFVNRPKVCYQNNLYSFPINLFTLYQLWGVKTPAEAKKHLDSVRIPIPNPQNMEEWLLANLGSEIYDKFFYGYTSKQWRKSPRDLPASIIKRLPIRLTHNDNYFNDRFQGIPIGGYTQIFEKLLDGIEVKLETPWENDWRHYADKLVYTGRPELLLDFEFGELEYLTLDFEHKVFDGDHQGNAIINYTELQIPYTRKVEHKHFEFGTQEKSVVTFEYPSQWQPDSVPYYPINTQNNNERYDKYRTKILSKGDIILGGRLGRYQYMNMDQVIGNALNEADKWIS